MSTENIRPSEVSEILLQQLKEIDTSLQYEEVDRIRKIVVESAGGTAEFATKVDPSIEGGFIFEINTYRLNASVADQMRRIKQQFIEKNRRIV